ncbi:MAG: NADH-quinone oxidoreductase subunit L [Actinomycetota bacterium]|nr:NADH-quinone oxidoreductase subunit L [Actinomycetota bacterium]MDA3013229.1 NADH-quinone oxidoreductase subunit L [Actinomycetota bacterium]
MENLVLVPVFLPLVTAIFLFTQRNLIKESIVNIFTLSSSVISFLITSFIFITFTIEKFESYSVVLYQWTESPKIDFSFTLDGLSALMLLLVSGLSIFIQQFSTSYMSKDENYRKYFVYFNFFVFSMLVLVMSSNFLIMFLGWELVGLSSYLLISFWSSKTSASKAGNKAFILNRIGDFGFLVGLMFILNTFKSFDFQEVLHRANEIPVNTITVITLFLILGAFGKSAQFPLFSWLPDAMEGPTPASALIHAATMVTAGVFMLVRISPLLQYSETTSFVVLVIGLLTALISAFSAINQYDIKKVLAYSTISQLGFMFIAIGVGAYVAAVFHLLTHAFFKALLFLGAGAVIEALHHEQDIRNMGGLRKKMPLTAGMMGIGTLAISGIPPLAGFWSKDEILASIFSKGGIYLGFWALTLFAAVLTAFYMGRHWLLIFNSEPSKTIEDIHDAPRNMKVPLVVLGIFSIFIGFVNTPFFHGVEKLLHITLEEVEITHLPEGLTLVVLALISIGAGFAGLFLAYLIFSQNILQSKLFNNDGFKKLIKFIKEASFNVLYLNKIGNVIFVAGAKLFSKRVAVIIDSILIDGTVNLVANSFSKSAKITSSSQTGLVRNYVLYFGFFLIILVAVFIVTPLVGN